MGQENVPRWAAPAPVGNDENATGPVRKHPVRRGLKSLTGKSGCI